MPKEISPERFYDRLKEFGITPDSSLADVKKASMQAMQKPFDPKIHEAIENLRRKKTRLWVDFFLFHVDSASACEDRFTECLAELARRRRNPLINRFLQPNEADLENMEADFREVNEAIPDIEPLELLEKRAPDLQLIDFIKFDS